MNRLRTIATASLTIFFIDALCYSPAHAQESAQESPAQSPSTTESKTPLDAVIGLFGDSPSDAAEREEKPTNPNAVQSPAISPAEATGETPSQEQPPTPGDRETKIHTDYAAAVREAQLESRPLLVVLGAQWCSWCREMEAELETAEAESILREWIVVKVDVDDSPEIAARLEASALPALRILGPLQSIVASREGYLAISELEQWLAENRTSADPAAYKVLYDTAAPDDAAIVQLISMLAEASPMVRAAAMERLAAHPTASAGAMVEILKTGRLVQQLSACKVLRQWRAPVGSIDPWRPESLQTEQIASLVEWSRQRMDADDKDTEASAAPEFDVQSASGLLQRLITAESSQRSIVIAQLTGLGAPMVVEARSRLAGGDALDDAAREGLRELLYNLLASRKLRLQKPGVLAALARLDMESHRQAAATILDHAAILDQPLIEELSRDADPLIRELAVRALGRLDLLSDGDRIQQLLNDSNPNVRTAVLRVLTEHPSETSVESLCAYLQQESDEDLLVHGAKCLGQLPQQPQAMATLAQLAANSSWRVRAAAIEATGEVIQGPAQQSISLWSFFGRSNRSKQGRVPEVLANAVVAAAFEDDAFVAERAAKLLPSLLQEGIVDEAALPRIAEALADHPEQFQALVEEEFGDARIAYGNSSSADSFPPLVKLAKDWLAHGESERIQRAVILLSFLAPAELNDRVADLIASRNRTIRLAGLRAAIRSIGQHRETSINAAVGQWSGHSEKSNPGRITPWYDLSDAEMRHADELSPQEQTPPAATQPGGDARDNVPATSNETVVEALAARAKALEAASSLFGDLLVEEAPAVVETNQTEPDHSAHDSDNSDNATVEALPSQWMEHWNSGSTRDRPEWLTACEAPTKNLIAGSDPVERAWALALWLTLGHADQTDELLSALDGLSSNEEAPSEIERLELLSWLPTVQRLAVIEERIAKLGNDGQRIMETLRQGTLVDDGELADWIFERVNHASLSDAKLTESLATIVLQSQVGGFVNDHLLTMLSAEDYEYNKVPPYRIVRSKRSPPIPGRVQACEWLRQRYHSASSDRQRAIDLMAVAQLDHKTAVDAAIGAIEEAKADNELVRVALSIVLGDAPGPSAQRATSLLTHQLSAVSGAACRFLATPAALLLDDQPALVPVVYDASVLPGLWRATEQFPVDELRKQAAEGEKLQLSQANLLLVAAGERIDLAQLEQDLAQSHGSFVTLSIAAALAKAGRSDEEAITFYRREYESANTDDDSGDDRASALYRTLRELPGDEVAELRRRMRKEKGSKLFNEGSGDDLFGF